MVQLTEEQVKALKELAKTHKISVAKLVRESVALYVASSTKISWQECHKRAQFIREISGKYHDVEKVADVSVNHDKYLAEIYGTW